ncbi:class I adenylate-forming enzyme family protein [Niveispirillum sp.]|uniref:AMP-binding protein n=1 Tax=Niveispirillum sp. TaxID=1917217 RepID=UPI001B6FEDD9|nr:class I adenylate-forming enzyme family protein [Niveispirillum sp.]MBP7338251.1 acyl--CoA ligase [Niveispirillum sp.]
MQDNTPPPWLNPRFRLVTGGRDWTWADLAARAEMVADGPLVADGKDLPGTIAALVAGWHRAVPIAMLRGGLPPPEDTGLSGRLLLLETSGTTGTPKRIIRPFDTILAGVEVPRGGDGGRWLLTYDVCGYAGLQVLLTAMAGGGVLLADPGVDATRLVRMAAEQGATHISATPSFWRVLLLSGIRPPLARITIGGEAVDQPLLDMLVRHFPGVPVRCIYASTEGGRLFTVADGREGFPAVWLSQPPADISFRIWNDMLQVKRSDDWIDTGDLVEAVEDRVLFRGRNDMIVNIGGQKVNPALAETRLLSLPGIRDAVVYGIANPITGSILAADIVAPDWREDEGWRTRVTQAFTDLPAPARPRRVRLLDALPLSTAGKKRRIAEEA